MRALLAFGAAALTAAAVLSAPAYATPAAEGAAARPSNNVTPMVRAPFSKRLSRILTLAPKVPGPACVEAAAMRSDSRWVLLRLIDFSSDCVEWPSEPVIGWRPPDGWIVYPAGGRWRSASFRQYHWVDAAICPFTAEQIKNWGGTNRIVSQLAATYGCSQT